MKISLLPAVGKGQRLSWLFSNPKISFLMRVSLFLWVSMTVSLQLAALHTSGQSIDQIEVTLEFKNARLSDVLMKIQNETKINFIYTPDQIDPITDITLSKERRTVRALLEMVLGRTTLTYKEVDGTVVLFKKRSQTGVQEMTNQQPNSTEFLVTGKVTDAKTGEPLPAVNVVVKRSSNGTSSDKNGIYSVNVENDNDMLVFSFIGYKTYEISVGGRIRIDVALESDLQQLKEVVINAGYYDVTDREKTGSISKVTSKVLEKAPVNNPLLALQGRVPGLFIEQTSGISGSKMNVSLRGKNSLQNGIDPLYIVDGVPFSSQDLGGTNSSNLYRGENISPFYSISSADIESIEILKDADATAIYGSRGANGVILITTKRGKQGKAKLNVNISTGASKVPHFLDLMNTQEWLKMRHQAFRNDNRAIGDFHYDINGVWDTTRNTNWQRELIGGTARYTLAQASISGGSQSTNYLLSGSFQKQSGVSPGKTDERKGSLLFSVSNESPNEKFKSRFSTNYVINSNDFGGTDFTGAALTLVPQAPKVYNDDGTLNWENSTWTNPLATINQRFKFKSYNLISNVSLGYEIIPRLEIKANLGLNDLSRDERTLYPHTIYDPTFGATPASSQVFVTSGSNRTWIAEPQVSWSNKGENIGKISAIVGGSFQSQERFTQSFRYENFASNALMDDPGSAAVTANEGSSKTIYKYAAIFARVNYALKDRYILNLTGRRDGSSRFGPGKQFADLGAVGAAWIFSQENIFHNISILSFGKLRSSYGVTGNDQIGDYRYLDTYRSFPSYDGTSTLAPTKLFNPNYAWETTRKFEMALELGFFNDRINLTGAYYNNRSSNQLLEYRVSSITGFTSVLKNFPAKIENSGIELELHTENTVGRLRWTTSMSISLPRNKLIEFEGLQSSSYSQMYVVGKSLNISKRYSYLGIDPVTGIYTFDDMNGDGSITSADRLVDQELRTKYYGGISNSFSFNGFTFDVFLQFVNKNAPVVYAAFTGNAPGRLSNQPKSILDNSWTSDNTNAQFQRFTTNNSDYMDAYDRYLSSTKGIVDASFIRLKNVSLSYKFPTKWTAGIESTLFIQGQNLLTLTNYDGLDPETGPGTTLPTLRTIVIGANISL